MAEQQAYEIPSVIPENPEANSEASNAILQQIRSEHRTAEDFVRTRRETFRDRLKLYNNQRKQRDKIGITTIYTMMNTLLAISYLDELSVTFGGKGISGTDFSENLELVAQSDYDEMDLSIDKFLVEWDRYFFGVGIEHVYGWDDRRDIPLTRVMDPLSWLPDPVGFIKPDSFRFMGFEVEMMKSDMTEEKGFIKGAVESLREPQGSNDEWDSTRQERAYAQGLDFPDRVSNTDTQNRTFVVLNWFTILNGKKHLVTTDIDKRYILRLEMIKPVFVDEKENPTLVPWGISLKYYSPERGNPFGVCVPDLVEDKQRAKSVLANLKVLKEKADLYPMYLYNREKILNRRDLDFAFNKFIGVRGDVDGAVVPLNKDENAVARTSNVEQELEREGQLATGATPNQSGVLANEQQTLGEAQLVQANANLRFLLNSKVGAWGETTYWELWYRKYVQYFPSAREKFIEVTTPYGMLSQSIPAKKFLVRKVQPRVIVRSKMALERQREKERVGFASVAPLILQDPTKPVAARRHAERYMMKLYNVPPKEVQIMIPPTPDEMDAHQENQLLARNEIVKIESHEDHLSHIIIHRSAPDTNANRVHVEAHRKAYVQTGQMERDMQMRQQSADASRANAATAQGQLGQQASELNRQSGNQPTPAEGGNNA